MRTVPSHGPLNSVSVPGQNHPMTLDERVSRIPSEVCVCLADRFLATAPGQAPPLSFSTSEGGAHARADLTNTIDPLRGGAERGRAVARHIAAQMAAVLEKQGVDQHAASQAAIQIVTLLGDPGFVSLDRTAAAEAMAQREGDLPRGATQIHLESDGTLVVRGNSQRPAAVEASGQAAQIKTAAPRGEDGEAITFWLEPVGRVRRRDPQGDTRVPPRFAWHVKLQDGVLSRPGADFLHMFADLCERAGLHPAPGPTRHATGLSRFPPPPEATPRPRRSLSVGSAAARPPGEGRPDVSGRAAPPASNAVEGGTHQAVPADPDAGALTPDERNFAAPEPGRLPTNVAAPQPNPACPMKPLVLPGSRTALVVTQALGTVAQFFGKIRDIGVIVTQFVAPAMMLAAISGMITTWRQARADAAQKRARESELERLTPDLEQFTAANPEAATASPGATKSRGELAAAALEHQALAARAARLAEPAADAVYVRDVPLQLGATAVKAVNWTGTTFGLFVSPVLSVLSGLLGSVAGVLHAVQGVGELRRAKQATAVLDLFGQNVGRLRGVPGETGAVWRESLVALTRSVSAKATAGTKVADLLQQIDDIKLMGIRKLTATVGQTLAETTSLALAAEKTRVRKAWIRVAFGGLSAVISTVLSGFAYAGVGGVAALGAAGALVVVTAAWSIYATVGLVKARRENRDAQTFTPTAQDRVDMKRWAGSHVGALEADLHGDAAPSRYLVSALLAKYLALSTKIGGSDEQTDEAVLKRALGKATKQVLILAGCTRIDITALKALAKDGDAEAFVKAVTRIAPHIFGKVALERRLAPFSGIAILKPDAASGAVPVGPGLRAGPAEPLSGIRFGPGAAKVELARLREEAVARPTGA